MPAVCWDHLGERATSCLQQYHVEATAVTPDYPSVSDFDRDFLGLSSRSQWSSMLHRTVSSIQVRKQISDRRISRLSLPLAVPYPRRSASFPGPCHSRIMALGPAFRVLSSSTRSRAEAFAALSSALLLSHIPRHCRLLRTSVYSTLALPPRSSSARTFEAPSKPHVHQTAAFSTCPRSPYTYIPSFFLFPSFFYISLLCSQHRSIHRDLFYVRIHVYTRKE